MPQRAELTPAFVDQLVDGVKLDLQRVIRSTARDLPVNAPGDPRQYVLHDELTGLMTSGTAMTVSASVLRHHPWTTAQIYLESDATFRVDIAGSISADIASDATAIELRAAIQPLLEPGLLLRVDAFAGRWILTCLVANSPLLQTIKMAAGYDSVGVAQEFHSTIGATVSVRAYVAGPGTRKISAGNLCPGWPQRGGVFVIPECRTWSGTVPVVTIFDPNDWVAVTGWTCAPGPGSTDGVTTEEPLAGYTLQFRFSNDGICEIAAGGAPGWTWAAGTLTVTFLTANETCDWTEITPVSGTIPAGESPTDWRLKL